MSVLPVGVLAYGLTEELSELVSLSLADVVRVWFRSSVAECREVLRDNPCVAVLATIPDSDASEELEELAQLYDDFSHSAWVGLFVDGHSNLKALARLSGHGVREILPAARLRITSAFLLALVNSETASVGDRVCQLARFSVDDPLAAVLSAAIRIAHKPVSLQELATVMRKHERSIRRYCDRHHLASPQWILGWARCFQIAYYLEETGRTVQSIAMVLGFETGAKLGNHLKRYTGHSPTSLRNLGAMETVLSQATKELRL